MLRAPVTWIGPPLAVVRLLDAAAVAFAAGIPLGAVVLIDCLDEIGIPFGDPAEVQVPEILGSPGAQPGPVGDPGEQRRLLEMQRRAGVAVGVVHAWNVQQRRSLVQVTQRRGGASVPRPGILPCPQRDGHDPRCHIRALTAADGWTVDAPLPPDFFERLRLLTDCDAMVFASLTVYRPYPPLQ